MPVRLFIKRGILLRRREGEEEEDEQITWH